MQRAPLSPLRIGTTIFQRKLPQSRESELVLRRDGVDMRFSAFNSTLINGKGRYPGGPATDIAVVNVSRGKRSVFCWFLGIVI